MPTGPSATSINAWLNGMFNATSYSVTTAYIQLHTADPGAAGTTAIAGNATRKAVSMGTAASGAITNDAAIDWTSGEVDTSETYSHFSLWDASTAGTFLGSGTLSGSTTVVAGDTFSIPIGDLDFSLTAAS